MYRPLTVTTIVLATAAGALLATPAQADPLVDDPTGNARSNYDTSVGIAIPAAPSGSLRISAPTLVTLAPGTPAGMPYSVSDPYGANYNAYVPTQVIDDRTGTTGWTASAAMTNMTGPVTIPATAFKTKIQGVTTSGGAITIRPDEEQWGDIALGTGAKRIAVLTNSTGAATDTTLHQALSIGKSNFPAQGGTFTAKMTNSVL